MTICLQLYSSSGSSINMGIDVTYQLLHLLKKEKKKKNKFPETVAGLNFLILKMRSLLKMFAQNSGRQISQLAEYNKGEFYRSTVKYYKKIFIENSGRNYGKIFSIFHCGTVL